MPASTSRRGFILLDVILALALIGSGVLVVMVFCRNEARETRVAHERLVAQWAAESELERLRAASYADLAPGERLPVNSPLPSLRLLKEGRVLLTVVEVEPGLKRATARVEWSSPVGKPLFTELTGFFSKEARP